MSLKPLISNYRNQSVLPLLMLMTLFLFSACQKAPTLIEDNSTIAVPNLAPPLPDESEVVIPMSDQDIQAARKKTVDLNKQEIPSDFKIDDTGKRQTLPTAPSSDSSQPKNKAFFQDSGDNESDELGEDGLDEPKQAPNIIPPAQKTNLKNTAKTPQKSKAAMPPEIMRPMPKSAKIEVPSR